MSFPSLSDAELILLAVAAFFVWESLIWVPERGLVFLSLLGERGRAAWRGTLLKNPRGGLVVASPLPWSRAVLAQLWPVSLSERGAFAYVAQSIASYGRSRQTESYVDFAAIGKIEIIAHEVWINGGVFCDADSPALARFLARSIRNLQQIPQDRRQRAIRRMLSEMTDTQAAQARLDEFHRSTKILAVFCSLLFADVFLLAPLLIFCYAATPWAMPVLWLYLIVFLGVWFSTILEFYKAHRAIYPDQTGARRKHLVTMFLSPAAAMRARDLLSRELLVGYHPLTVALLLCPAELRADLAGRWIRDAGNPQLPVCPPAGENALATESWFRARMCDALDRCVRRAGLRLERLRRAPPPDEPEAQSYCPRCHGQYTVAGGSCRYCGGIALVPLPGANR
jgi:hypothetical protein